VEDARQRRLHVGWGRERERERGRGGGVSGALASIAALIHFHYCIATLRWRCGYTYLHTVRVEPPPHVDIPLVQKGAPRVLARVVLLDVRGRAQRQLEHPAGPPLLLAHGVRLAQQAVRLHGGGQVGRARGGEGGGWHGIGKATVL
jgi:hypothetical protein